MMSAETIAAGLKARKVSDGSGWAAKCPAHHDTHPSLAISDGRNGEPVVFCHAGCSQEAVIDALRARGLWKANGNGHDYAAAVFSQPPKSSVDIPVDHAQFGRYQDFWDYFDEHGGHVLRICRWDIESDTGTRKEVRPLSLQTDGSWAWKQREDWRPLYRLPDLQRDKTRRVLLVEGEKTAEAAAAKFPMFTVTTWAGGSKAYGKTDWLPLVNRDVTLLADHDAAGTAAMDAITNILKAQRSTVRRLNPADIAPDLPEGWDVADIHPDQDFDLEKLRGLIDLAPIVCGQPRGPKLRHAADIVDSPIPAAWLLRPYLEELVIALLYGELGTLKSFVTLDMLLSIAADKSWAGSTFRTKARPVVYVSAEGKGLGKRIQAWAMHHMVDLRKIPFYAIEHALDLSNPAGIEGLVTAIEALNIQPAVVGIDTLSRNAGALDENSTADMAGFVNALDLHLRQRLKCTVILVHHTGHQAKERARGSYSLMSNTDANYRLERPDTESMTIKFTTGRLKDSESPAPIFMRAHVVDLGTTDEDGQPETSLVVLPTDDRPPDPKKRPSGTQQAKLLRLLESEHRNGNQTWTTRDLRKLAQLREGMPRSTAISCVTGLTGAGFLKLTVGGLMLVDPPGADLGATPGAEPGAAHV